MFVLGSSTKYILISFFLFLFPCLLNIQHSTHEQGKAGCSKFLTELFWSHIWSELLNCAVSDSVEYISVGETTSTTMNFHLSLVIAIAFVSVAVSQLPALITIVKPVTLPTKSPVNPALISIVKPVSLPTILPGGTIASKTGKSDFSASLWWRYVVRGLAESQTRL